MYPGPNHSCSYALTVTNEYRKNREWKTSDEFLQLKAEELAAAREQRALAKASGSGEKVKTTQTWRGKKYKVQKIERGGGGGGIDAWRYVKHVAKPLMWPACKERQITLMEDNAPAHKSFYTNKEREKFEVEKLDWPSNSPDFNPIEHIWALMKKRILTRRGEERITTVPRMQEVLIEEWEKISVEEINYEIDKLPIILAKCIKVNGSNNFHA